MILERGRESAKGAALARQPLLCMKPFERPLLPLARRVRLDDAAAVCLEELAQICDTPFELHARVNVGDHDALLELLHDVRMGGNVPVVPHCVLNAGERLVRGDAHAPGVEEHRVARDPRLPLVGAAESAVDDDEAAMRFAGIFALLCAHGDVPVHDAAPGLVEPERGEDAAAEVLVIVILVIGVLRLLPGRLILDERALKRGDVATAEDGGVAPAPEEPEKIAPVLALYGAFRREIALPGELVAVIEKIAPAQAVAAEFKLEEAAVPVAGDAAVVKQVPVVAAVDRTNGIQEARMLLQTLAVHEGRDELAHQGLLLPGELRRVGGVDGGEVRIPQGIFLAVHRERALFPIHTGEHIPVIHMILRMAVDGLPFQLEQDDADGLMHARVKVQVARLEGFLRQLARLEDGSVARAVLLRGKQRKRQQVDAVAIFEHV